MKNNKNFIFLEFKKTFFYLVAVHHQRSMSTTLLFSRSMSNRLLFSSRSTVDARRCPFYSLFHHASLFYPSSTFEFHEMNNKTRHILKMEKQSKLFTISLKPHLAELHCWKTLVLNHFRWSLVAMAVGSIHKWRNVTLTKN